MRILVVVDILPCDINAIGRTTAKVKAVIVTHEIKNRAIRDIPQHGNFVDRNPDLEHNYIIFNDCNWFTLKNRLTFFFLEFLIWIPEN
jgi:hypothetical protein